MKDADPYLLEMLDAGGLESKNFSINDFLKVYLEYSQNGHWFSQSREMSLISSFVVLIVLGIVSNGLVFFIIVRNGIRKSSRNLYIMNLAVSDILTCVLCKPLTVVRLVLKNWTLGEALCRLVPSLQTIYVFVSTLTLVALAVDRYRAITNNGNSIRSQLSPCYGLASIWIVSVAIAAPLFAVHRVEEVKGFNGYVMYTLCLEQWRSPTSLSVYTVIVLLLQYLSPLLAIVILHLLIGSFLRMHITADGPYRLPDPHLRRKRCRHRKNMILLTSMAVAFAVAWLPLNLVNTLATIYPQIFQGIDFPFIHAVCILVAFTSVCINPVIYGLLNTNFKRDLRGICKPPEPRRSPSYCRCLRGNSRTLEQCGLISGLPQELSNSTNVKLRDGITAV